MMFKCPHCNGNIKLIVVSVATDFYHPNPEHSIDELHLSTRAHRALISEGHDTIGKVLDALNEDGGNWLRRLPNFGNVSFNEVCGKLRRERP